MRKILVLVLLVALSCFVIYLGMQHAKNAIADTVSQFYAAALSGKETTLANLAPRLQNKEEVAAALQTPGLWRFGACQEIRLLSLHRAAAEVLLFLDREPVILETVLVRRHGRWEVLALPDLAFLPFIFLTASTSGEATFIRGADGKKVTLAAHLNLPPYAAGSGIVLDGKLVHFTPSTEIRLTKLLRLSGTMLESENLGHHNLDPDLIFFQEEAGEIRVVPPDRAYPGMEEIVAYVENDMIKAVLLPDKYRPQNVRVLIKTTNFANLLHREIRLSATAAYTLEDKIAKESYQLAPGQVLLFRPLPEVVAVTFPSGETRTFSHRLHLSTSAGGKFRVENLRRGTPPFVPEYRGKMEISLQDEGLLLCNELPLEAYLYSVVASEMPANFGLEALKVQAVAARTYAVASVFRNSLQKYGAHVDDSVAFQVYNNVPENPLSITAVEETRGLIVTYNGAPADTRFFSTSAGVTASAEDVWHDDETGNFPGVPVPYLTARPQLFAGTLPEVDTEAGARAFLTSAAWDSYDSSSPWFRWQTTMTRTELEGVLTRTLPERWQAQPQFVLTKEQDQFVSKAIPSDPLGTLLDLQVIRRGRGGNLMEIEITGTKGTYRVRKEYNIRFLLRPQSQGSGTDILLQRADGSTVKNYSLLPSAFCVFTIKRDVSGQIETVHIAGGGNGHGVGMSQWGARGLAEKGFTYRQILEHYYPGCAIENY